MHLRQCWTSYLVSYLVYVASDTSTHCNKYTKHKLINKKWTKIENSGNRAGWRVWWSWRWMWGWRARVWPWQCIMGRIDLWLMTASELSIRNTHRTLTQRQCVGWGGVWILCLSRTREGSAGLRLLPDAVQVSSFMDMQLFITRRTDRIFN